MRDENGPPLSNEIETEWNHAFITLSVNITTKIIIAGYYSNLHAL